MWIKKANGFQNAKVQSQGVAQLLHNFLPTLSWCCLPKCCLKKACLMLLCKYDIS